MLTRTGAGVVIAGGGIAAITAAHALRDEGFAGTITIVSDEPHEPYSRPALSKGVVSGTDDDPSLPPSAHGAHLRAGRVAELDATARRVRLDDGTWLAYDGLVIATGARARTLGDPTHALRLRDLSDAHRLRDALVGEPRVGIIGGGALAMELASQCRRRGSEVTLFSRRPAMAAHLGDEIAGVLQRAAHEHGVRFRRGETFALAKNVVTINDEDRHDVDLVITAVGDVPNDEWLRSSGLLTDGALVVDRGGIVAPGVVAAGDVAVVEHAGTRRRTALWTSAIEQAKTAARSLVGAESSGIAPTQSYFWTEQFDQNVKAVGPLPIEGPLDVLAESDTGRLLRWRTTAVALNHRIPLPRLRRAALGD